MRAIYRSALTAILSFVVMGGVLTVSSEKVACAGKSCTIGVDGTGVAERTGAPEIVGPHEFNAAKDRSYDNTRGRCSSSECASQCGGSGWSAQMGESGVRPGYSWDLWNEYRDVDIIRDGGKDWYVYHSSATCICTEDEYNEPVSVGDRAVANPYTSPIITPITSFFKRLFGRGK